MKKRTSMLVFLVTLLFIGIGCDNTVNSGRSNALEPSLAEEIEKEDIYSILVYSSDSNSWGARFYYGEVPMTAGITFNDPISGEEEYTISNEREDMSKLAEYVFENWDKFSVKEGNNLPKGADSGTQRTLWEIVVAKTDDTRFQKSAFYN